MPIVASDHPLTNYAIVTSWLTLLIVISIDASKSATEGIKELAQAASSAGATKEEFAEALMTVFYLSGCRSFYTAAEGIGSLF